MSVRENTIVQVVAEQDIIQTLRPDTRVGTKLVAGSGVIIDAKEGLIISNAHVTENSINTTIFSPVTGRIPLHCELVSILREKDLSLLRIIPKDLKILLDGRKPEDFNARPVDHLNLKQGCHLYAAGYPLGTRHLQVTNGCLSGLSTGDSYVKLTQYEDSLQREPTFIVTSAGLNHGMSGGGLFDENGGLVGIITAGIPGATQIGFAIPSRVVAANLLQMKNNITPNPVNFHFRWTNVSDTTASFLVGHEFGNGGGMMIRHVLPDSIFYGKLQRGDLVKTIEFDLPGITEKEKTVQVIGNIETHGDLSLRRKDGKKDDRLSTRKFSIPEIVDYIHPGSQISVKFYRGKEEKLENIKFESKNNVYRIRGIYHVISFPRWMKIGGIIMQDTTLNNLAECSRYKYISEIPYYDDFLFTPSVIITYIEPGSEVGSLSAFAEGDIVIHVNGQPVQKIDDIEKIIQGQTNVAIESDRGAIALCSLE